MSRFADEPELTKHACPTPSQRAQRCSNSRVSGPIVSHGPPRSHSISSSRSRWSMVSSARRYGAGMLRTAP